MADSRWQMVDGSLFAVVPMNAKVFIELLKETFKEWTEDKAARLGAALAYYALFSIAPLLIIAVAIAGLAFGEAAAQGRIVGAIEGAIGEDAANVVQDLIANIRASGSGLVASLVGVGTLVLGASGLFYALKDALNTIWEVAPKPERGLVGTIRDRALAIAFVLGSGFLLIVVLAASTTVAVLSKFVGDALPGGGFVWQALDFVMSFGIITLLFAVIYKVLPDVDVAWSDVGIGAAFTSLLFTIGAALLGLYLGRSSAGSVYGAAGSLVVILIWVYYSAQIFFFGAEFTQVYARRYGSRIRPAAYAVRIVEEARARQETLHTEVAERADRDQAAQPAAPAIDAAVEAEEPAGAQLDRRVKRERYTAAAIGAGLGVIGGILLGLLGPLIGVGPGSKKKQGE